MTFLLIDGTNLAHRLYHIQKATSSSEKLDLAKTMRRSITALIEKHQPTHCAIAFDNHEPTRRHQQYPEYKQGRKEKEFALRDALAQTEQYFIELGSGIVAPIGYEADDVLATLATKAKSMTKLIYSGDRNLFQLVDETTAILYPHKGKTSILDAVAVYEKMQVHPHQITDFKGLYGDTSDNIPGVPRIGAKTASTLLAKYNSNAERTASIEEIFNHLWQISPAIYQKLRFHQEIALLSKKLATLERELSLAPCTLQQLRCQSKKAKADMV
ncbi:DNA polymerase I (plasmid) [Leptolyngbya sp. NIES-3755]|nr:DNA polymerase I [Leptolyngbya sp. NIES-3755]